MAKLPTRLTDRLVADLPWLNDANGEIPPRLDVSGHSGKDITTFRDALYASKIPTKEVVKNGITYVQAATDVSGVEQRLAELRLKHLQLIDEHGKPVTSHTQFNSNTPLRTDNKFADIRPNAYMGARAENPAALKSLQNLFHHLGHHGNDIVDGKFEVLASRPNAQLLQEAGAIKGPYEFNIIPAASHSAAHVENASATEIATKFIQQNRLNIGLGSLLLTADAALAAAPALEKGEYADAALLALNSTTRLATELIVTAGCSAGVAAEVAPLSLSPPVYAGAMAIGTMVCAKYTQVDMIYGDKAMAAIETRVKEVAASNGLDPNHIWASMLEKAQGESATPVEKQPAYEP